MPVLAPPTLEQALRFLRDEVAPRAAELDADEDALRDAMRRMGDAGLLALRRPQAYGGPEWSEAEFREFQIQAARASGVFAFLQTQHQSAVAMLSRSDNERLKAKILPQMHSGERLVGIGFSQLRRPGPPSLRAEKVGEGYRLEGHVPWCTGEGFYGEFLAGAQLPDGRAVFGLAPLRSGPGVRVGEPMRLTAMETARTVTVDFDGHVIPPEHVAFVRERGWIQNNDRVNVALQGQFAVGCALAALDVVRANAERKGADFVREAHDRLLAEVMGARAQLDAFAQDQSEQTTPARLAARAEAIAVMQRCALAAVTSSSGGANYAGHPAGRVLRESLVFAVSAQTSAIMEATLARIVGAGGG